ncbi:MAG: helix-turn-helix transcriptional regulator [Ruminococcaceae bacterium]|mgnify:CR=1 FL=1|nr:helix-turn-helix transcriptional regulator [Oscillospiraceae bacterium]
MQPLKKKHPPTPEDGAGAALTWAALGEMEAHYAEFYGVQELADCLQVSKCHLIRSFTAAVGLPPGQYLTQVRLAQVKRLLLAGEFSLEAIAGLCGFSGANYLCKVFKKHTGLTPSAWRRQAPPTAQPLRSPQDEQAYL